jgi:hypothetical protein
VHLRALSCHLFKASLAKSYRQANRIFHHFEKSFAFLSTLKNHLHFSPIWKLFSPRQVTHYNETTLKTLFYFSLGRSLMTIRPFQNSLNLIFQFFLWVSFTILTLNTFRKIHHFLIWWVCYLSLFFSLQSLQDFLS